MRGRRFEPAGRIAGVTVFTGLVVLSLASPASANHDGDELSAVMECVTNAGQETSVDVRFSERSGDGSHRLDISAELEGLREEMLEVALLDHDIVYELRLDDDGDGSISVDSRDDDEVPPIEPEDMIEVRHDDAVIISRTFVRKEDDAADDNSAADAEADVLIGSEDALAPCPDPVRIADDWTGAGDVDGAGPQPATTRDSGGQRSGDATPDPVDTGSNVPDSRERLAVVVTVIAVAAWVTLVAYIVGRRRRA